MDEELSPSSAPRILQSIGEYNVATKSLQHHLYSLPKRLRAWRVEVCYLEKKIEETILTCPPNSVVIQFGLGLTPYSLRQYSWFAFSSSLSNGRNMVWFEQLIGITISVHAFFFIRIDPLLFQQKLSLANQRLKRESARSCDSSKRSHRLCKD